MTNPHEPAFAIAARPAVPGNRWGKIAAAIVAGLLIVGSVACFALWYFTWCGDCGASPIICRDPCELPHFSQRRDRGTGSSGFLVARAIIQNLGPTVARHPD